MNKTSFIILFVPSLFAFIGIILLLVKHMSFICLSDEPYKKISNNRNLLFFKHKNKIIEQYNKDYHWFKQTRIYHYNKIDFNLLEKFKKDKITLSVYLRSLNIINKYFFKPHSKGLSTYAIIIDKNKDIIQQLNDFIFFIRNRNVYEHTSVINDLYKLSKSRYIPLSRDKFFFNSYLIYVKKPSPNEDIYFISVQSLEINKNLTFKYHLLYAFFTNTFYASLPLFLPIILAISYTINLIDPIFIIFPLLFILRHNYNTLNKHFTQDDDYVYISNLNNSTTNYIIFNKKENKFYKLLYNFHNRLNPNQTIIDNYQHIYPTSSLVWFKSPKELYHHTKNYNIIHSTICIEGTPINFYLRNFKRDFNIDIPPSVLQFLYRNYKIKNNPFGIKSPYKLCRDTVINKSYNKEYNSISVFYPEEMKTNKRKLRTIKLLMPFIKKNKLMPI